MIPWYQAALDDAEARYAFRCLSAALAGAVLASELVHHPGDIPFAWAVVMGASEEEFDPYVASPEEVEATQALLRNYPELGDKPDPDLGPQHGG